MTTIVAVEKNGDVRFASDTRVSGVPLSDGWVEKVVRNGEFVFGTAGHLRAVQVLQYAKLPAPPHSHPNRHPDDTDRFVTKELVPAIKSAFDEASSDDALEESVVIASVSGRAYQIYGDGAWVRNARGFYSVGSGSEYALGALEAGAKIKKAVEIASIYDSGTNGDARIFEESNE